jgi:hypothetical protein
MRFALVGSPSSRMLTGHLPTRGGTERIRANVTGGETVFCREDRAVAWFPVSLAVLRSPDGRTWAGASGPSVYLLRLEGLPPA